MRKIVSDVPRKGNVDRNIHASILRRHILWTFPARGTWIEIATFEIDPETGLDVPRKGNVDRNLPASLSVLAVS